jgi:hypothetical protein
MVGSIAGGDESLDALLYGIDDNVEELVGARAGDPARSQLALGFDMAEGHDGNRFSASGHALACFASGHLPLKRPV